jgi:hypothetical protein
LRNELNRSKLGKTHKKILLTELAYRDLDSPNTCLRWNDKPEDDSNSDSLFTLKDGLDSMERKEWHLRYKRMNGLLVEIVSVQHNFGDTASPENRVPSKQPVPNPPYRYG